jgi:hypothetical protein
MQCTSSYVFGTVVAVNGKVVAVGMCKSNSIRYFEIYNVNMGTWETSLRSTLPSPDKNTIHFTSTKLGLNSVLVCGGYTEDKAYVSSMCELLTVGAYGVNSIKRVASMNHARADHLAFPLPSGNEAVVIGGIAGPNQIANAEVYNVASNTWTSKGNSRFLRSTASAGVSLSSSGAILLVGGGTAPPGYNAELFGPNA